jgi:hypothetical protein
VRGALLRLRKLISFHRNSLLVLLALGIVCGVFMWPRIDSAQFGLLDDGATLRMAQTLSIKPLSAFSFQKSAGRFFPAYWLENTLIYQFARFSPRRWYLANFLILLLSTWGIYWLVRLRAGTVLQSMLAGLFYCLSAATVESFYTLSKAERLSLLWLLAGTILVILSGRIKNRLSRIGITFVAFLAFLIAYMSKEPTIVTVGIMGGWLATAWLIKTPGQDQLDLPAAKKLFLLQVIVTAMIFVGRTVFVSPDFTAGAYASNYQFDLRAVIDQLWRWLGRFVRDYLYILPLMLGLLNREIRSRVNLRLVLDGTIWMAGWLVIFLPWNVLEAYHTLPFTLGASIVAGMCAGAAMQVLYGNESRSISRVSASLGLVCALILGQFTLVNNIYLARTQLLYDLVNSRMMNFLGKTPRKSSVYFNIPPTEYITETARQLDIEKGRGDLTIGGFQFQRPQGIQPLRYYVITPVTDNMFLPNVRNSVNEIGAKNWDACFKASINEQVAPEYSVSRRLRWIDFGFNRLLDNIGLKDLLSYHLKTLPFLAAGEMKYGWEVYKLTIDPKKIAHPGIFNEGQWTLREPGGKEVAINFGNDGSSPVTGDFDGDGWTDQGIYEPDTHQFRMDIDHDGQPDLGFQLGEMRDGDVPVFGDWDGNGSDTPGYYRASDASWHIRNSFLADGIESVIRMETQPGGIPLAGDWDGNGFDTFGMYYPDSGEVWIANSIVPGAGLALAYTSERSASPVVADWYGFGVDTIALVKEGQWWIRPNNISCEFSNPLLPEEFEDAEGIPVAGRWK